VQLMAKDGDMAKPCACPRVKMRLVRSECVAPPVGTLGNADHQKRQGRQGRAASATWGVAAADAWHGDEPGRSSAMGGRAEGFDHRPAATP